MQGRLALSFNFDFNVDFGFCDATQVGDGVEFGHKAHSASCHNSSTKSHFVHAIIHEHVDVVDFDDLVPHVGQQAQGEVAVGDGAFIGTFALSAFNINVYPLVVECGIGKLIDAFLVDFYPWRGAKLFA